MINLQKLPKHILEMIPLFLFQFILAAEVVNVAVLANIQSKRNITFAALNYSIGFVGAGTIVADGVTFGSNCEQ